VTYHDHQLSGPRPLPFLIKAILLIAVCTIGAPLVFIALFALGRLLNFLGGF
jgi:hypothetical protein